MLTREEIREEFEIAKAKRQSRQKKRFMKIV